MNWNEFKEFIDGKLAEQDIDGDINIYFIDTGTFPATSDLVVLIDDDKDLTIV